MHDRCVQNRPEISPSTLVFQPIMATSVHRELTSSAVDGYIDSEVPTRLKARKPHIDSCVLRVKMSRMVHSH